MYNCTADTPRSCTRLISCRYRSRTLRRATYFADHRPNFGALSQHTPPQLSKHRVIMEQRLKQYTAKNARMCSYQCRKSALSGAFPTSSFPGTVNLLWRHAPLRIDTTSGNQPAAESASVHWYLNTQYQILSCDLTHKQTYQTLGNHNAVTTRMPQLRSYFSALHFTTPLLIRSMVMPRPTMYTATSSDRALAKSLYPEITFRTSLSPGTRVMKSKLRSRIGT